MTHDLDLPDLYEAAARATINERCAQSYLHDIRGTMQALFSAVELLGRSARAGSGDMERVERACDLARRAISRHEQSTINALHALTMQQSSPARVDFCALVLEVIRFLRNETAAKALEISFTAPKPIEICVHRAQIQTVLIGVLSAAIDDLPIGAELPVAVERSGTDAILVVGSSAGCRLVPDMPEGDALIGGSLPIQALTLLYARRFLRTNGGALSIDTAVKPRGSLMFRYPAAVS